MATDEEFLRELQQDFLTEAKFLMDQYEEYFLELEKPDANRESLLNEIFRVAHSIKGAAAATEFSELSKFAHKVEDYLSLLRESPRFLDKSAISLLLEAGDTIKDRIRQLQEDLGSPWDPSAILHKLAEAIEAAAQSRTVAAVPSSPLPETTVEKAPEEPSSSRDSSTQEKLKVNAEKIEEVLSLVGELVILKSQITHSRESRSETSEGSAALSLLDKTIRELYDKTLSMRLTEMTPLFLKCQRAVRDVGLKLNKHAEFQGEGQETQVDRAIVDSLGDPIIHLIRNAMDHGLEFPEERTKAGKTENGLIRFKAQQSGSQVRIDISDNGRGIDRNKIIRRCLEIGLVANREQAESLSDTQLYSFIFYPGFSTAPEISDISGRGVGLDLVKDAIERLKGTIEIISQPGVGTTFRMRLPLTTAISDGMVVTVNGYPYIIPIHVIREITSTALVEKSKAHPGHPVISLRKRFIPLIQLDQVLAVKECPIVKRQADVAWLDRKTIAVVESKGIQLALSVDTIVGQSQFVTKPLTADFVNTFGISGSAILGDGRIALVLDVDKFNPNHNGEAAA